MMRKVLMSLGLAGAVAAGAMMAAQPAEAKTHVYFGFGVGVPGYGYYDPYYPYYPWPYYRYPYYYRGPVYGPGVYYYRRPYVRRYRLTCRQARRVLRRYGYRRIRTLDCRGKYYVFRAWRKGYRVKVTLNSRTGRIVRIRRR